MTYLLFRDKLDFMIGYKQYLWRADGQTGGKQGFFYDCYEHQGLP